MLPAKLRYKSEKISAPWRIFLKSEEFVIRFKPNESTSSRFAIIISVKTAKKAVQRNLLKRRIRGLILKNLAEVESGRDFLIKVLPPAVNLDKKIFEKKFLEALINIH